jgi:hypothetical protein
MKFEKAPDSFVVKRKALRQAEKTGWQVGPAAGRPQEFRGKDIEIPISVEGEEEEGVPETQRVPQTPRDRDQSAA